MVKNYWKSLCLISLLFVFSNIFAQTNLEDVIYLNNGSVIRGVILEQVINEYIKIQIIGGNILVFQMDEIEKIIKEEAWEKKKLIIYKNSGYINVSEVGLLMQSNGLSGPNLALTIQSVNGYQFNQHLSAGIGLGIDLYFDDATLMPLFLDIRGSLLKNTKVTPFYYGAVGYSFGLLNENSFYDKFEGGLMINSGVGIKIYTRNDDAFIINLGYKLQESSRAYYTWGGAYIEEKIYYRRISFRIGLSF